MFDGLFEGFIALMIALLIIGAGLGIGGLYLIKFLMTHLHWV